MIEVHPQLWVGGGADFDTVIRDTTWVVDWYIVSCGKEPWHREALGYTGCGAPKDHPEYLIAARPDHLILNLVDVEDVSYINPKIIEAALEAITENLPHRKVLVHCNQGNSRAPTIALLWMRASDWFYPMMKRLSYNDAKAAFKERYPTFEPAAGMDGYARKVWEGE